MTTIDMERCTPNSQLTGAIRNALGNGGHIPCATDPLKWCSDDKRDRAEAAQRCLDAPCPVIAECHRAAIENSECFVWGGVDHGSRRSPKLK